jgi:hypothetical protein
MSTQQPPPPPPQGCQSGDSGFGSSFGNSGDGFSFSPELQDGSSFGDQSQQLLQQFQGLSGY